MVEIMALVRGRRPGDETVIRVGSKNVSQRDMSRLDGPVLPKSKRSADLWLNDSIITYILHILRDNDKSMCQNDKERKPTYFAGSYFYMLLVQQRHDNLDIRGNYDYQSVARCCARKVPEGNLLNVRASYLPVLVNDNHWVGSTILNEAKEILVYNPSGREVDNDVILNNLLKLVGDEYKRLNGSGSDVNNYLNKWSLIDVSKQKGDDDTSRGYPCQENSKCQNYHHCHTSKAVLETQFFLSCYNKTMTVGYLCFYSWHFTAREFQ